MSDNPNYWDRPDPPKDFFERVEGQFENFMYYETYENGHRNFICSACHTSWDDDPAEQKRTVTPKDVELWRAKVNDTVECPHCHASVKLKNLKLMKNIPSQMKCNIAVLVDSPDSVWLRCYISYKRDKLGTVE